MRITLVILLCFPFIASSVDISGVAPDQVGESVRLLRYDDYITRKTEELGTAIVDKDSSFSITYNTQETFKAILEVGNVYSFIYVQPDGDYKLLVPAAEGQRLGHNFVEFIFEEVPPEDDINFLILDFDYRVDGFMGQTFHVLADSSWHNRLNRFKKHMVEIYDSVENIYFINYMTYSIAMMEMVGHAQSDAAMLKEITYQSYIHQSPIFYRHDAYMRLINNFYTNIFGSLPKDQERQLLAALVIENVDTLRAVLAHNPYHVNARLSELIMIKGLGEAYMSNRYPRSNIIHILEDLTKDAIVDEHKHIAQNMIGKLTKLQRGYPAPEFTVHSDEGDEISLTKYRGEYVYLTFFETWCTECIADMRIMTTLQKRYGEQVKMVSVCMDEDPKALDNLLKEYQEFDWTFLKGHEAPELKSLYDLVAYPSYILIDPEGNVIQYPALRPSPKGNYESIDKTMYNIKRNLTQNDGQDGPPKPFELRPPKPPEHDR